jgi:lysophospholipase L1-like esterase
MEETPFLPERRTDPNSVQAHEDLLAKAGGGRIDAYFLGDSITRRWGCADPGYAPFLAHWRSRFSGWNAGNFGWGGDTLANILWRIRHGELEEVDPKVIVLMGGTNDVGAAPDDPTTPGRVWAGLRAVLRECRTQAPKARIILMGILPRADSMAAADAVRRVNSAMPELAQDFEAHFVDLTGALCNEAGEIRPGMLDPDLLHAALPVYEAWADAIEPILLAALGPPAEVDLAPPPTADPRLGP